MKYYVSKVDVRRGDPDKGEPCVVATEVALTKPSSQKAAAMAIQRWKALGIENLCLVEHKAKRYNKLIREQNKHRKTVSLTVADIARMTKEADTELKQLGED